MIKSIEIKGLRGIKEGKLEDLTPLVILVGPNGCGKSTVLDALLISAGRNPGDAVGFAVRRHSGIRLGARWLLHRAGANGHATLSVRTGRSTRRVDLSLSDSNPPDSPAILYKHEDDGQRPGPSQSHGQTGTRFAKDNSYEYSPYESELSGVRDVHLVDLESEHIQRPLDELFTRASELGFRSQAISFVTDIVSGSTDLEIGSYHGEPLLYMGFQSGSVPVALAGEGLEWLTRICFVLASRADGVVLIEEPEAHQHPGAIRQSARAIWAAVRRGIQVILSTHSLELIDSLLAEAKDDEELTKLSLYRLLLVDGCLRTSRHDGAGTALLRTAIDEDLR